MYDTTQFEIDAKVKEIISICNTFLQELILLQDKNVELDKVYFNTYVKPLINDIVKDLDNYYNY